MNFKSFDVYGWSIGCFLGILLVIWGIMGGVIQSFFVTGPSVFLGSVFSIDVVSYYLVLLSLMLGVSLLYLSGELSGLGRFMIVISVLFSLLSYCSVHAVWFWVFYEMSILPLLLLLIVESPYSERYVAGWYLLGYVVLTSLPMLLCLIYMCLDSGSFLIPSWQFTGTSSVGVFVLLGIMFITKIPLPPFHVWLPIVHAEASSSVSVCLSGYIMKLGILGVCRFCFWVLPSYIFSPGYMLLGLSACVLFFFSATRELDGKRWLAFLSLSHILISAVCLCLAGFDFSSVAFVYCLGHGISAGVVFIMLWVLYEVSGSRNWGVLKYSMAGSLVLRCLCGACLCTAASLPPTLQFFSEVFVVVCSSFSGISFFLALFIYLFMGGLVPMFLLGSLLTRHYTIGVGRGSIWAFLVSIGLLVFWGFTLFLVA